MSKIITIVVPSYNAADYLLEDIPSFLEESILDDIEILIVNDGSKDNTQQVGEEFQKKYPGTIRVINKENGGHGSTINTGMKEANGKYFKVVDADDWVDTEAFLHLVTYLKQTDADLILTPFHHVDMKTRQVLHTVDSQLPEKQQLWLNDHTDAIEKMLYMHAITYRTEILQQHQITIDENCFYVDQEYNLFPIPWINTVVYLNENVYQYRVANENQSVSTKNLVKNYKMHQKVTESILQFWLEQSKQLKEPKVGIIKLRCLYIVALQFNIFLLKDQGKKELAEFDQKIKREYREIYESEKSKKMILLRKLNYHPYAFLKLYLKRNCK